jgi:hypothetical protein
MKTLITLLLISTSAYSQVQAPIKNAQGFTAKGYTAEDINNDGSSIHFTSGKTISNFKPTTTHPIIYGTSPVQLPKLNGDWVLPPIFRIPLRFKILNKIFATSL